MSTTNVHDDAGTAINSAVGLELSEKEKAAQAPARPAFTVPDGGWEAWSVVLGGWMALFSTFGYINGWGVYQAFYVSNMHKSNSSIAWIGSFQLWLMFTMGLFAGRIFDEGHCRLLILVGSIISVFAVFMTSLCTEYWQVFLAQGVCLGIGLGTIFLPAVSVIPHWFQRRRALATGIVVSGSSVGGVIFPILLNKLFLSIGYAQAVRASGYILLGCLTIACLLIKPRIPGRKHRPAHLQFPPPDFKAIFSHKAYLLTIAGGFLVMWGIFFPFFYVQIFAEVHGVDENLSFYLLSILNAASIFGRVLPNFIADYFGVFNMLIGASFFTGVLNFVLLACTNTKGSIAFSILYGFFSGAYVSLLPGVFASLSSHVGEIGLRMGLAWAIVALAALSGTPIDGALLGSTTLTWWKPAVFSGTTVLVGAVFLLTARTMHARAKGTAKV